MRVAVMRLAIFAMLVACSGSPRAGSGSCGLPIVGTEADYTPPTVAATIAVSSPKLCEHDEAYVRIERTTGARRLGTGRSSGGGFDEGCMKLPANAADAADCPVVNVGAILHEASDDLQGLKIDGAGGDGLGPCGDINGNYAAWNMAVGVRAWRDLPTAVSTVASLLEKYDVHGYVGVSVRGIPCAYAQ